MISLEALQYPFLERPLRAWLIGILVCLATYLILRIVLRLSTARVQSLSKRTHTQLDDLLAELLSSTGNFFLWSCSAFIGSRVLEPQGGIETIIHRLIILVSIFQAATWGSRIISFWIENYLRKRTQNDIASATTVGLISTLSTATLYATLLLLALNNFGVNITALIAGLGVGGIAVALAAQNILGDLFASLTIVLDKPFVIGDAIKVGDLGGAVEHIGLKTTRLRAAGGELLIFSNTDILKNRLHNFKRMTERRVALVLSISHTTSANTLQSIPGAIRIIVESQPQALFDRCHLTASTDSGFQIELVYVLKNVDFLLHMDAQQEILLRIIRLFENEKVEFASRLTKT